MVNLWYGGQIVHNEDTGVGQETFTYSVDDTAGRHVHRQVCKSGNPATPFMPAGGPYPYDGIFTDVDASTENPYAPPGSDDEPGDGHPDAELRHVEREVLLGDGRRPAAHRGRAARPDRLRRHVLGVGPVGRRTNQNSFIHRSTNDGQEFHLVADIGARPDLPPGGGDTDIATDDQGNVYFTDLEGALAELGASVSHDNGMNWTKNPAAVQQHGGRPAVVRGRQRRRRRPRSTTRSSSRSTRPRSARSSTRRPARRARPIRSAGSSGRTRRRTRARCGPLAADAICAKLRFDPVTRNLYYACNEGNHIRVTVGHVAPVSARGSSTRTSTGRALPAAARC